jgi:hypothetical protein
MDKIRSSVDLIQAWARITGTSEKSAFNRIRFLRDAGLIPNTHTIRHPLRAEHMAVFIVGMLGSATHDGAAAAVRDYAELETHPVLGETALSTSNIIGAVATLLRHIRDGGETRCVSLTLGTTHRDGTLILKREGDEETTAGLRYISPGAVDLPRFKEDRTVSGEVLHELAALLADDPPSRADREAHIAAVIAKYEAKAGQAS